MVRVRDISGSLFCRVRARTAEAWEDPRQEGARVRFALGGGNYSRSSPKERRTQLVWGWEGP